MALSNKEIKEEINNNIIINPYNEDNLQVNSYDVTLGENFYREVESSRNNDVYNIWDEEDVKRVWKLETAEQFKEPYVPGISTNDKVIWIKPLERILAHTQEFIGGKNRITTMMKARSSLGRSFISVCLCAGLGDIGYTNRWTLEITNHSRFYTIPLVVGRRIAQIVFFHTGETSSSYTDKGKYQQENDNEWHPSDMLPRLYLDREITNNTITNL